MQQPLNGDRVAGVKAQRGQIIGGLRSVGHRSQVPGRGQAALEPIRLFVKATTSSASVRTQCRGLRGKLDVSTLPGFR